MSHFSRVGFSDTINFMAKKKKTTVTAASPDDIERSIHVVRGQRVMLDSDLAKLYSVTTSALNQAVKRNADRFPDDFAFQLAKQEYRALMSQIVISKTS